MENTIRAEGAIIGTLLIYNNKHNAVSQVATPEMFSNYHQEAKAIWSRLTDGKPCDAGIIATQVSSDAVFNLLQYAEPDTVVEQAEYLQRHYLRREGLKMLIDSAKQLERGEYEDVTKVLDARRQELEAAIRTPEAMPGKLMAAANMVEQGGWETIPTGFADYDTDYGGWRRGWYYLFGARMHHGKTTTALHMANAAAVAGHPTAFYSFELLSAELLYQLAFYRAGINLNSMMTASVREQVIEQVHEISNIPLYVYDHEDVSSEYKSLINSIRRQVRDRGVRIVFIDYVQKLTGNPRKNRNYELEEISKNLYKLCKQEQVTIVNLAQVRRDVQNRADKRPYADDLKDAGSLEQDADGIVMQYRPAVDGILMDSDGNNIEDVTEFIVRKHRFYQGKLKTYRRRWKANKIQCDGWEQEASMQPLHDPNEVIPF